MACRKIGIDEFSVTMMHVLWAYDDYFPDDDMPAKKRAGRIVKGRMRERGNVKGRILPAAKKLILLTAAYWRGPYIFEVIDVATFHD